MKKENKTRFGGKKMFQKREIRLKYYKVTKYFTEEFSI